DPKLRRAYPCYTDQTVKVLSTGEYPRRAGLSSRIAVAAPPAQRDREGYTVYWNCQSRVLPLNAEIRISSNSASIPSAISNDRIRKLDPVPATSLIHPSRIAFAF